MGQRRWYAVAHSGDLQRRRVLVLHLPSKGMSKSQQQEHGLRQMTYQDTLEDLYEPGLRVKPSLRALVGSRFRSGLESGFKVKHDYHPVQHHGKIMGGW